MAIGFLSMASFSGLWTVIAFLLSGPQYGYSEAVIGLFSLAGLAGAAMASFAGRVADRGHVARRHPRGALAVLAGWGLIALGETSLAALLAGLIVLDLGDPGDADPQPERDLPAAPGGAQPAEHGLHDLPTSPAR